MTEAGVRPCDAIDLSGGKLLSGLGELGLPSGLYCLEAPIRNPPD
jgi:hypothetical protein